MLFTKTSIKEACDVIRKRLENDKTLKKRTNLSVNNITELLTYFIEDNVLKIWRGSLPTEVRSSHIRIRYISDVYDTASLSAEVKLPTQSAVDSS